MFIGFGRVRVLVRGPPAPAGFRPEPTQPELGKTRTSSRPARASQPSTSALVYRFSIGAENRSNWSLTQTRNG